MTATCQPQARHPLAVPCQKALEQSLVERLPLPDPCRKDMVRGGPRHFVKPVVDIGILHRCLCQYDDVVQDLGAYEHVSRNQATDVPGLLQVVGLLEGLVKVSTTCEVHPSTLRSCFLKMVMEKPALNHSNFNGQVWANTRTERVGVLLAHLRRLRAPDDMRKASLKLRTGELQRLKDLVAKIDEKEGQEKEPEVDKTSNVSVDSAGFPRALATPEEKGALTKGVAKLPTQESPVSVDRSFFRRRLGDLARSSSSWQAEERDEDLAAGVGACMKRPAGKKPTKREPLTKLHTSWWRSRRPGPCTTRGSSRPFIEGPRQKV